MNENKYKEAFNAISPSEEALERIYEITSDKKKFSYKKVIRQVAAAAIAFVLVIGGGFCIDYITERNYFANSSFDSDKLSVLVAYASEKGHIEVKKAYKYQDFFYRIFVIDYTKGKEASDKARGEYYKQSQEKSILNFKEGVGASSGGLHSTINDINDHYKTIGMLYTIQNGGLVLNINNFTDIKDITFENTSKYAEIQFEYAEQGWYPFEEMPKDVAEEFAAHPEVPVWHPGFLDGHKFSITGEKLQWSLESGMTEHGVGEYTENYGYSFYWDVTEELINELDHNIDFDLSQIQDTITFTVNYLDGTIASTSIHISCDKDGYIHLSNEQ